MTALAIDMTREQDRQISEAVEQQRFRLRNFIRRRVADPGDVEDILQEVFFELVEAYRLMKPVEIAGAWLFQVARNRIIDRFRKKKPEALADLTFPSDEGEMLSVEEFLPSADAGPEAAYIRTVLIEELEAALDELPDEQHQVFIAHEIAVGVRRILEIKGEAYGCQQSGKICEVVHYRHHCHIDFCGRIRRGRL